MTDLATLEKRLADYRAVKGPHWMVEIARTVIPKLEADIAALKARSQQETSNGRA